MMAISNFTDVAQSQPCGSAPGFGNNNDVAFTGSLFYGGKIFDHVGAFIQGTYDQVPNSIHWDNLDIRYANTGQLSGAELVYGTSLNNNPTVNDVWNSTPAWGYPYVASQVAPPQPPWSKDLWRSRCWASTRISIGTGWSTPRSWDTGL